MPLYAMRLWLPDRPGALGAVATRVGAVRADVVGIDIIERGAGRAVDELTIDLPDEGLLELLVAEVGHVEGVDVEDLRALGAIHEDPSVTALEVAASVAAADGEEELASRLIAGAVRLLRTDWAALVDMAEDRLVAGVGDELPNVAWICGFVRGSTQEGSSPEVEELAVAAVPGRGWTLVVSRDHLPLRGRERDLLLHLGALG